ncbi:hypothetical protein NUW54_g1959 [Trametes sanguinea]|uniref:Uncharacterized protein n=1 Tax=Trametes sanguinea TaxID=158606 RepID=A0ACC1Q6P0_9APHY|nr:hypothetical protein NUW54_g1959 [Trametes sanguinea]
MPRENRKRGKKHKKKAEEVAEVHQDEAQYPEEQEVNEAGPSWIVPARDTSAIDQNAPFGYVDAEVKAYFRTVDVQIREWQETRPEVEEDADVDPNEDRRLFFVAALEEMSGKEKQLATDPDCSTILERMIHSMDDFVRRVFMDRLSGSFEQLSRHRFASHVCQTLLIVASDTVAREARGIFPPTPESQDEEGELRTLTQLVLDACEELLPTLSSLILDPFASHVIRALLSLLAPDILGSPTSTPTSQPTGGSCGGVAAWSASSVYTGGQQATYQGHLWTAKWWTQGDTPGGAAGVWTDNGSVYMVMCIYWSLRKSSTPTSDSSRANDAAVLIGVGIHRFSIMALSSFMRRFCMVAAVALSALCLVNATEVMQRPPTYKNHPHNVTTQHKVHPHVIHKRASTGKVQAAYFTNWGIYGANFQPTDINPTPLTHIVYAFADVSPDTGTISLTDSWADEQKHYPGDSWNDVGNNLYGNLKQLYLLKLQNRNLKVVLSIGGWTYSQYGHFSFVTDATKRATFVTSAVSLIENYGFDGIDIDFEYPSSTAQASGFASLLTSLRTAFDNLQAQKGDSTPYELSAAVPAGSDNYQWLNVPVMDKALTHWNLMAYDYAGSWLTFADNQGSVLTSLYKVPI